MLLRASSSEDTYKDGLESMIESVKWTTTSCWESVDVSDEERWRILGTQSFEGGKRYSATMSGV